MIFIKVYIYDIYTFYNMGRERERQKNNSIKFLIYYIIKLSESLSGSSYVFSCNSIPFNVSNFFLSDSL